MYNVPELSNDEDALTASHRAWSRVSKFLSEAHTVLGSRYDPIPEDEQASHSVENVDLLLETDIDPESLTRWGWIDVEE